MFACLPDQVLLNRSGILRGILFLLLQTESVCVMWCCCTDVLTPFRACRSIFQWVAVKTSCYIFLSISPEFCVIKCILITGVNCNAEIGPASLSSIASTISTSKLLCLRLYVLLTVCHGLWEWSIGNGGVTGYGMDQEFPGIPTGWLAAISGTWFGSLLSFLCPHLSFWHLAGLPDVYLPLSGIVCQKNS